MASMPDTHDEGAPGPDQRVGGAGRRRSDLDFAAIADTLAVHGNDIRDLQDGQDRIYAVLMGPETIGVNGTTDRVEDEGLIAVVKEMRDQVDSMGWWSSTKVKVAVISVAGLFTTSLAVELVKAVLP